MVPFPVSFVKNACIWLQWKSLFYTAGFALRITTGYVTLSFIYKPTLCSLFFIPTRFSISLCSVLIPLFSLYSVNGTITLAVPLVLPKHSWFPMVPLLPHNQTDMMALLNAAAAAASLKHYLPSASAKQKLLFRISASYFWITATFSKCYLNHIYFRSFSWLVGLSQN